MGQPKITPDEAKQQVALCLLSPGSKVPFQVLRASGLHRDMVLAHYDEFASEIKNLVGWKILGEHSYPTSWYDSTSEDRERGELRNAQWLSQLDRMRMRGTHAVLLFDGERRPAPALDYRLYILRDGRLLFYAGGHYARHIEPPVCGDVLTVLAAMDDRYSHTHTTSTEPFVVIIQAFSHALEGAIENREKKVASQRAKNDRFKATLSMVTDK